ncbi:sigma-70 family RNA polymerase sigma factor [Paenibacillus sp. M1]|uniref:Sigma-70 family RNA polymerase sigma factor n=1 Tax=Paenibacillus haidiansis TaxID=1574488 RepID=A0ABU7VTG1_9BACL
MNPQNEEMTHYLREMCEGSVQAFDLFYSAYAPFIMQVALKLTGERMEAEDVCHEVFLEVLRKGKDYDPARGSIRAWLAVKTRSRCLDRLRRKQRIMPMADEALSGTDESGEDQALSRLERDALRAAVHTLPETQRKAILGSYFTLQTHREMSEAWNVPIGTVKSWVRYGLGNLRKQLEQQGWSGSTEGGKRHGQDR